MPQLGHNSRFVADNRTRGLKQQVESRIDEDSSAGTFFSRSACAALPRLGTRR